MLVTQDQNFIQTLLYNWHTLSSHLLQHPHKPPPVTAKKDAVNSSEMSKQTSLLGVKTHKMPPSFLLFHHLTIGGHFIIARKRCLCVLCGHFCKNLIFWRGVILHFGKQNSLQFTLQTFLTNMQYEVLRAVKITVFVFRKSKLCDLVDRYNILEKSILSVFYHENGGGKYVGSIGMLVPNHQTVSLNIPEHHNSIHNAMLENMTSSQMNTLKQYSQTRNNVTRYSIPN